MRRKRSSTERHAASHARQARKRKAGIAYQEVVADIARAFSPSSVVQASAWFDGPDGRRDMDVLIEDVVEGRRVRVMIECKDYKPRSPRPLGIEFVDAIAGKMPDLGLTTAVICSNAGFTEGAIKKASRHGIGLIGVMRQGDDRIRVKIVEEAYVRNIVPTFGPIQFATADVALPDIDGSTISFRGERILDLIAHRLSLYLGFNQRVVRATFTDLLRFSEPLTFTHSAGPFQATALSLPISFTGAWYRHLFTYDAKNGAFDWIRRRVRIAGSVENSVSFGGVDLEKDGEYVSRPPEDLFAPIQKGEVEMQMTYVHNTIISETTQSGALAIEQFILPEDLEARISDVVEENFISAPGFIRPERVATATKRSDLVD